LPAAVVLGLSSLCSGQAPPAPLEKPVDFNRDILPIHSDACCTCHGPEEDSRRGKLRLDTKDDVFADRGGYRLIVPGNSAASKLYQRLISKQTPMPPVSYGRPLIPRQIELLREWIDQGANWQSHWAFDPLTRLAVPEVTDTTWPRNPTDIFMHAH